MKKGNQAMVRWKRWLAKASFFIVVILLFESYRDIIANRSMDHGIAVTEKLSNETIKKDIYTQKLNTILQNLEFLQKNGQLVNVELPGKSLAPDFALVKGSPLKKHEKLLRPYSSIPCKLGKEPSTNWGRKIIPRFPLDSEKYLYPILKNQPVDQLIGLRQSILLAIKLNRTLVMPYFHNHNYGGASQYNPALLPGLKVNVDLLRRFISVISVEEMQQKCNGKFDVALMTGHIEVLPGTPSLLKAQSELQMRMLNTMNTSVGANFRVRLNIPRFPKDLKPKTKLSVVPKNLETIYPKESGNYKCAVHPFPLSFFDIQLFLRKAMKMPNHKIDIFKMKDEVLYSAIWYYTQPPAYIQMLAAEIIENVMKAQQIDGVFNFLCLNYHKHTDRESEDVDMNTLRNILNLIVQEIAEKENPLKLSAIYISSPQSKQGQAKLYRENLKIFEGNTEIPVFSGDDVIDSWRKYFHGDRNPPESMCALLEDDTQDTLSLVETQICTEAAVFIRSIGSSWAANVQANREKSDFSSFDASIKDLIEKQKGLKKKSGGSS